MSVLVDTNMLLRRLEPRHAHYRNVRPVAVMPVRGIGRILTFNVSDFAGYGVSVLHPSAVT